MNVTALLDTGGDAVERYVYDPYGRVTIYDDDWSDTRFASSYDNAILYCGYYHDSETGLYHVRHRSYHPRLGRWLQRDSEQYVDGAGLYEYVSSGPTRFVDYLGNEKVTTGRLAGKWPGIDRYIANVPELTIAIIGYEVDCDNPENSTISGASLTEEAEKIVSNAGGSVAGGQTRRPRGADPFVVGTVLGGKKQQQHLFADAKLKITLSLWYKYVPCQPPQRNCGRPSFEFRTTTTLSAQHVARQRSQRVERSDSGHRQGYTDQGWTPWMEGPRATWTRDGPPKGCQKQCPADQCDPLGPGTKYHDSKPADSLELGPWELGPEKLDVEELNKGR